MKLGSLANSDNKNTQLQKKKKTQKNKKNNN